MDKSRILIVEPAPLQCGSISSALRSRGHPLVVSEDPGIVDYLDEFIHVDLVILDIDAEISRIATFGEFQRKERIRKRLLGIACPEVCREWKKAHPLLTRSLSSTAAYDRILSKPLDYVQLEQVLAGIARYGA